MHNSHSSSAGPSYSSSHSSRNDPRLTEAVIPTLVLAGLVDYARACGVAPEAWFAGTGLSVALVQQSETLVSFRQAATLIRRALRSLPADGVGLQLGSREGLVSFGMLGFAMMSSRTFLEAAETGIRHHQACGSLMDVSMGFSATEATLQVYERFPDAELLPFLCEELFSSSLAMTRAMLGHDVFPLRVDLSYPPPTYAAAYRRLFNCPVHFNCDANRMVLDAVLLNKPLPTHSPVSLSAALDVCRKRIQPSVLLQDVIVSVEGLLRENFRQRLSMAQIASRLNVTERTLRRHLLDAGQNFSAIRDRVLEQQARSLLNESLLPIATIATELGFSDLRDFRRAFRRWTGMAPMSMRRSQAGVESEGQV